MDKGAAKPSSQTPIAMKLLERLKSKSALIGVIGLGYVGLPLCLTFAEAGVKVLGFDIDPDKPKAIAEGRTYLKQFSSERIAAVSCPSSGDLRQAGAFGSGGFPAPAG